MPKLRTLLLNQAQREELLHCRNLLFPPVVIHEEQAQADLNAILACAPALYGIQQTRWTLESLLSVVQNKGYLVSKIGSLHRLLSRLGLRLVRARYAYRSPDPH